MTPDTHAVLVEALRMLRRSRSQICRWVNEYGERQPPWLPPAGNVELAEDIDTAIADIERTLSQTAMPKANEQAGPDDLLSAVDALLAADTVAVMNGGGAFYRHVLPAINELRLVRAAAPSLLPSHQRK